MKNLILFLAFSGIVGLSSAASVITYKATGTFCFVNGDDKCCKKGEECKSACCKMVDGKMICDKKGGTCTKAEKAECKKGEGKACCHKNAKKEEAPKK